MLTGWYPQVVATNSFQTTNDLFKFLSDSISSSYSEDQLEKAFIIGAQISVNEDISPQEQLKVIKQKVTMTQ